jgi:hypothetical protein
MLTVALLACDAVQSDTEALTFQRKFLHPSSGYYRLRDKKPTYLIPYSLKNDKKYPKAYA